MNYIELVNYIGYNELMLKLLLLINYLKKIFILMAFPKQFNSTIKAMKFATELIIGFPLTGICPHILRVLLDLI